MLKKISISLGIGFVTFCVIYVISSRTNLFVGMERGMLNGFFYLREPGVHDLNPYVSDRVKLLGYDEDSIAVIGKWPWKRYVHAEFLDKIERFSPEAVFFDLIFAKPESVPRYITDKLALAPEAMTQVKSAFAGMDNEFARALARYDNVYLDLQLVEEKRESLPVSYKERIAFNEENITAYSLPVEGVRNPVVFQSLEPILDDYVRNAHPVVINVLTDDDGVIRLFPLFYTYQMGDGSFRNIFTVALSLLQRYYHVGNDQIDLLSDRVVLKNAKVPVLDPDTHRTVTFVKDFTHVADQVVNPEAPSDYAYNENLYRYLVHSMQTSDRQGPKNPDFPLHGLVTADGRMVILDGWEIFDAARHAGAGTVDLVLYREMDVHIDTPVTGFYHVNYAGKDERLYQNPQTGKLETHTPIPTDGYRAVYSMDDLPDIPELDNAGNVSAAENLGDLSTWFYHYCLNKSHGLTARATQELGDRSRDDRQLQAYMARFPEERRFADYAAFFKTVGADPSNLTAVFDRFPAYADQAGLPDESSLDSEKMIGALVDAYRDGFERYYNTFIFTGGNATGLGDVQQTPYAGMYGVNVIINGFNTIATGNPLKMSLDIPGFDILTLAGVCLISCLLYGMAGIRIGSVLFAVTLLGTLAVNTAIFFTASIFVSTTPLISANGVIFVGILVIKLLTEEKDKKFIKDTFSTYLAPELIHEMHQTKTMPRLGGETRVITAFFTDIQSFSTFSEKLTPQQLVELLNEYLTAMTDILIHEKGTLDKYEGDAIIAFFGAPMDLPDQELRACRVAIKMQEKLGELRKKWRNEKMHRGDPDPNMRQVPEDQWPMGDRWPRIVHDMRMRIGINTGEIVVGNMGSTTRMNYTMMGDSVNLAARLEAAAKQYGIYNLVSEYTLDVVFIGENGDSQKVMDMVETRFVDRITVVGRSEPVKVYELIAMKGDLSKDEKVLIDLFQEGVGYYRKMEWDKALAKFTQSQAFERFPFAKTTPSELLISRCRAYKKHPPAQPGQTWDGVFRLTMK